MLRDFIKKFFGWMRFVKEKILNGRKLKTSGIKYFVGKASKISLIKGKCVVGKKVWLSENCLIRASTGKISIGENNFFNSNCKVIAFKNIEIGNNNLFGQNVIILDHNHKYDDKTLLICKQGFNISDVCIGSNIWVGANVTICAGVKICDDVVIGANSVVTKDISQSGVYVGSPVRFIKNL